MKLFGGSKKNDEANLKSIDTVIGRGAVFDGTVLETEGGVCVDGTFKGKILSRSIVLVNHYGMVFGEIIASFVAVHGEITGNVTAKKQLDIGATGKIQGDVAAASITIVKGGVISGYCSVITEEDSIKELEAPLPSSHLGSSMEKGLEEGSSLVAEGVDDDIIRPFDPEDSVDDADEDKEGIIVVRDKERW